MGRPVRYFSGNVAFFSSPMNVGAAEIPRGDRFLSLPRQHTVFARCYRQRYDTLLQQCCNFEHVG